MMPAAAGDRAGCRTQRHERADAAAQRTARPRSPSFAAAAACRLRWPTPPCAAAGASCCSRCADGPIRSASPPIRITGPGWASSAASCGSPTQEGCRDVVFIGSVARPSLWQMRPDLRRAAADAAAHAAVPRRRRSSAIRRRPHVRAARLSPARARTRSRRSSLMPHGADRQPRAERAGPRRHRARAWRCCDATSPFDIGQAVVVADNQVLAVEGPEGTDQALARVAELRRNGRIRTPAGVGVLVKAAKIGQDHRIDLPSIGPHDRRGRRSAPALPASRSLPARPSWPSRSASRPRPTAPRFSSSASMPMGPTR